MNQVLFLPPPEVEEKIANRDREIELFSGRKTELRQAAIQGETTNSQ